MAEITDTQRLNWLEQNYFLHETVSGSHVWKFYTPDEDDPGQLRSRLDAAIRRHGEDDALLLPLHPKRDGPK